MIAVLLRKELKESFWKLTVGTLVMITTALSIVFLYDFILDLTAEIPSEIIESYGISKEIMDFLYNYPLYIWSQWNGKNLAQIGAIIAIVMGMSSVANEVSNKTIGFLLSRPVKRSTVFAVKAAGGVIAVSFIVLFSTMVLLAAVGLAGQTVHAGKLMTTTIITLLGLLIIFSTALLLSVLLGDSVKAGAFTALLLFANTGLAWYKPLQNLSLFSHIGGARYFVEGIFPWGAFVLMFIVAAVLLAAGAFAFSKKEY